MAAKHLLDFYSAFGILLVFGKKKMETGTNGLWRRNIDYGSYIACDAAKQGNIWGIDPVRHLYAFDDSAPSTVGKMESGDRNMC